VLRAAEEKEKVRLDYIEYILVPFNDGRVLYGRRQLIHLHQSLRNTRAHGTLTLA
jgi:hypothetical protein